jgi:hypothetical protein
LIKRLFGSWLFRYFLFESFDSIFLLSSLCKVKVRFVFQWKLDDKALFRSFPPVKRLQLTAMSFKSILFSTKKKCKSTKVQPQLRDSSWRRMNLACYCYTFWALSGLFLTSIGKAKSSVKYLFKLASKLFFRKANIFFR